MERIDTKGPDDWVKEDWSNFSELAGSKKVKECFAYVKEQHQLQEDNLKLGMTRIKCNAVVTGVSVVCATVASMPVLLLAAPLFLGWTIRDSRQGKKSDSQEAQLEKLGQIVGVQVGALDGYRGHNPAYNGHMALSKLITVALKKDGVFEQYDRYETKQDLQNEGLKDYLRLWCESGRVARRKTYRERLVACVKTSMPEALRSCMDEPITGIKRKRMNQPTTAVPIQDAKGKVRLCDPLYVVPLDIEQFKTYLSRRGILFSAKHLEANFGELKKGLRFVDLGTLLTEGDAIIASQQKKLSALNTPVEEEAA